MKKLLLSVFALSALATSVKAQVYTQDFEGTNPLASMTTYGTAGTTINGTVADNFAALTGSTFWTIDNTGASKAATTTSWITPVVQADNYLVTPQIMLPGGATYKVTWKAESFGAAAFLDPYTVKLSTGGNAKVDFTTTLFTNSVGAPSGGGESQSAIIAVTGNVYIAFVAIGNDDYVIAFDDIVVEEVENNDMLVESINVDSNSDGDRTFTITCKNNGLNAVTAFDLDWSFDGGTNTTVNVTGVNLAIGDSYDVVVNVNGVGVGTAAFNANITTSDDDNSNNELNSSFTFVIPVPQFVGTDSDGNPFDLHAALSSGQSILLDFMASWCGPCESSTPEISEWIQNNGSGLGRVQAIAITTESTDTDAVLNGLNWNGGFYHYPKFAYTAANNTQYNHYATMNNSNGIPLFVLICPNISDPGHSTIIEMDAGFGAGMFPGQYNTSLNGCSTAYLDVDHKVIATEINVSVYPNPVNTEANVNITLTETSNVTINIVNTLGQTVYTNNLGEVNGEQLIKVNTSDLEAGMYFVNVTVNGTIKTERITVSK